MKKVLGKKDPDLMLKHSLRSRKKKTRRMKARKYLSEQTLQ